MRSSESNTPGYLSQNAGHTKSLFFDCKIDMFIDKTLPKISQFQLTLGDYFKSYLMAQDVAGQATDLIERINNHGNVCQIFDTTQNKSPKTNSRESWSLHIALLTLLVGLLTLLYSPGCLMFTMPYN